MTATLAWQLPPLLRVTAGDQLLDVVRAIDRSLAPHVGIDRERLQESASQLVAGTSLRITAIAADGRVLADSDRTAAEVGRMDNHAGRPEVAAALASGHGTAVRRSGTTQRRYVYAARAFPDAAGDVYVLRLAQPLDELALVRRQLVEAVAASLVATLLAAALFSLWLDRRLLRPLARLIDGAVALAAGRRHDRLPVPEQQDLAELATAVNRLTDRLEAQMGAVTAERDHLQAILASMSEGVLVVDGEGRVMLANPEFRRLFALGRGELAGRRPLELVRQPELADLVAEALAGEEARREEVEVETDEGRRTLSLAGAALSARRREPSPSHDDRGDDPGRGAVIVARDTSELVRLARMRSDFVANVSHELKTPLTAIRGYSETLRDGALDEAATARRFLDRILDQSRRLELLLDDLLTLSRLESPEAPVERQPIDLRRLLERAVETVASHARQREVELRLEIGDDLPTLTGDPHALERLLLNLLDNAVKYNRPGGSVLVGLAAVGSEIEITVADTGIGIPSAALDRIFERFYRVDKGRSRDEGGTGLGLAIVKHVAQSHGGRVEVTSRPGEGSTFRVSLPAVSRRR
ncbi:MAG TPA: ATP-binding protein [Thermoanaerobaculia bacterium]|nr:ATP-binding protein [Thermoanaerobaculia bacterium]